MEWQSNEKTYMRIQGQVSLRPEFFFGLTLAVVGRFIPRRGRPRPGWLSLPSQRDRIEGLEETNEHERSFVVRKLLA
jgi:hypothetical protein